MASNIEEKMSTLVGKIVLKIESLFILECKGCAYSSCDCTYGENYMYGEECTSCNFRDDFHTCTELKWHEGVDYYFDRAIKDYVVEIDTLSNESIIDLNEIKSLVYKFNY
jgi:hypothetical protein